MNKQFVFTLAALLFTTLFSCQSEDEDISLGSPLVGKWTVQLDASLWASENMTAPSAIDVDLLMAPAKRIDNYLTSEKYVADLPQSSVLVTKNDEESGAREDSQDASADKSDEAPVRQLTSTPDSQDEFVEVTIDFQEDGTVVASDMYGSYNGQWSVNDNELLLNIGDLTQIFEILSLAREKVSLLVSSEVLDQGVPTMIESQVLLKR